MKKGLTALVIGLLLSGQALAAHHEHKHDKMMMPADMQGKSVLSSTTGNQATGWVLFAPQAGKLHVWGEVLGLTPGQHGFHIHEFGDCSSGDGTSAGGHFTPQKKPHGAPTAGKDLHHAGDLGNITADATGKAKFDLMVDFLSLHGMNSVLGRAVVVHAGADDLKSQPSGDAGSRVACGIVGIVKKTSK